MGYCKEWGGFDQCDIHLASTIFDESGNESSRCETFMVDRLSKLGCK